MARHDQQEIETFMSITGVSQAAAVQKLEEHNGSINEAVNAHFTDGDRQRALEPSFGVPQDDIMDIDDPIQVESRRPHYSLSTFARDVNHFSSLEPDLHTSIIDKVSGIASGTYSISHPKEIQEIPVDVKDYSGTSTSSENAIIAEDITETAHVRRSGIRGAVILDDNDDDYAPNVHMPDIHVPVNRGNSVPLGAHAPTVVDVHDDSFDIEEEMIRAAIEASRQDAALPNHIYDSLDLGVPAQPVQIRREDAVLAHAVSLSLQTAEKEQMHEELEEKVGVSQLEAQKSSPSDEMGRLKSSDERLPQMEIGSTSVEYEDEDVEERQLVRHRRRRMNSSSTDAINDVEEAGVNPPSSPPPDDNRHHPEQNGSVLPSEWGGISSQEHDEAVMLEAAMFGGIPEGIGYHAPHQMIQNDLHRDVSPCPWSVRRPPSPSLTAQRLIREQDDEYLASLQADREKELKAQEEAEVALAEKRRKEDEFRKQLEEEEEIKRQLAAKEASLPQEPTPDDENAITLLVRMPDGSRKGRRFQKSNKLQYLFDFIDVSGGIKPGSYRLVRPYPRQAFSDGECSSTLSELGLTSKQEALYLELI